MLQRVDLGSIAANAEAPLARVAFGRSAGGGNTLDIVVPLAPLGAPDHSPHADRGAWCDVFPARGAVRHDRAGDVTFATDGQHLVGRIELDESRANGLRAAAQRAYASLFAVLDREACGFPLRIWNYVPRINAETGGLERYRQFNIGRQEAFLAAGRAAFDGAPAACALGSHAERLSIHFLAGRRAPVAIENPRQVSAYRYPTDYGPRAPTFSRASVVDETLFLSGTASIVGHASQHPGDPVAQTAETFVNIRAVVAAAQARLGAAFDVGALTYTIYVRHREQFDPIRTAFVREVGAQSAAAARAMFVLADICRAELLVEIEATGTRVA